MECEDHDILEVGRVRVLDRAHEVVTRTVFAEHARKPTGSYLVDDAISHLLDGLGEILAEHKCADYALNTLRITYKNGDSLSLAFARLLSEIFRGKGLVVVDPTDPGLKRLASPVFEEAILKWKELNEAVISSSEKLVGMGYEPQIETRGERPPFFLIKDGERVPLLHDSGSFRDPSGQRFTDGELASLLKEKPEAFSPNVSLRPLVQDYLFLTDAYVAGPGEVSYFAQIAPVYGMLDLDMPPVFPRAQFTMVEPVVRRVIEKLGVTVSDFTASEERMTERFLQEAGALTGLEALSKAKSELHKLTNQLTAELLSEHSDMAGPLETYRKKTSYQFERLEDKLRALSRRRHDTLTRQIRTARNHLFPLDRPQERVLNTCYLLAQSGEDLARKVFSNLDPFDFTHRVLNV
jgi:bacillithiol biosynthesis cysteine-adding enzyme BshC